MSETMWGKHMEQKKKSREKLRRTQTNGMNYHQTLEWAHRLLNQINGKKKIQL